MRRNLTYLVAVAAMLSVATGWSFLQETATGLRVVQTAKAFVTTLSDDEKAITVLPPASPQRVDWHVIPKAQRKGLQLKQMSDTQRQAALALLRSVLSQTGYDKAVLVMALEETIGELEKVRGGRAIRDPDRYYFTLFGEPSEVGRWGLSIEGHHLSLNFVIDNGRVIASTPLFLAANPTVVRKGMPGSVAEGTRVLAEEELLAFRLWESLDEPQRKAALLDAKAPRDLRAAGQPQPPAYSPDGLATTAMNDAQQQLLQELIAVYTGNLPADLASTRWREIAEAGYDKVYFAWAGADRPGLGHYYRIQGPTFLIEFANTQSDSAGNAACHIHSVWRDPRGDFAVPAKRD
ncbi:MAG: DUF3500 domain-containing protein [Candidatus Anammoximicrobium sp.]|nr:DUF3500 domain-containing protein [Candidatus Anammoximicrobium sp.]